MRVFKAMVSLTYGEVQTANTGRLQKNSEIRDFTGTTSATMGSDTEPLPVVTRPPKRSETSLLIAYGSFDFFCNAHQFATQST